MDQLRLKNLWTKPEIFFSWLADQFPFDPDFASRIHPHIQAKIVASSIGEVKRYPEKTICVLLNYQKIKLPDSSIVSHSRPPQDKNVEIQRVLKVALTSPIHPLHRNFKNGEIHVINESKW
jgi:hypothetical protein